jgi:hypothetical protein
MSPKPRAQERKAGTSILHQDLEHDIIFSSRNLPSVGNLGNGNMQRIYKGSCILRQIPLGTCRNMQEPVTTVRYEETA